MPSGRVKRFGLFTKSVAISAGKRRGRPPGRTTRAVSVTDFAEVQVVDHAKAQTPVLQNAAVIEVILPNAAVLRVNSACSPDYLASLLSLLGNH